MLTIHVQSVLASLAAGGVIAAAQAVFPDRGWNTMAVPGLLGCIVGYLCVGPAALLAASGILPIAGVALWIYLAGSAVALQPGWYYRFALVATVFAGAVAISAIARTEDDVH